MYTELITVVIKATQGVIKYAVKNKTNSKHHITVRRKQKL